MPRTADLPAARGLTIIARLMVESLPRSETEASELLSSKKCRRTEVGSADSASQKIVSNADAPQLRSPDTRRSLEHAERVFGRPRVQAFICVYASRNFFQDEVPSKNLFFRQDVQNDCHVI
jgi:hypothetical protein